MSVCREGHLQRVHCVTVCREGQLQRVHHVLNECLVDRGASPNMVQLEAYVDGHHITTVQVLPPCLGLFLNLIAFQLF